MLFLTNIGREHDDELYRIVNSGRGYLPIHEGAVSIDTADFRIPHWWDDEDRPYTTISVPLSELVAWIAAQPPMSFPPAQRRRPKEQATESPG